MFSPLGHRLVQAASIFVKKQPPSTPDLSDLTHVGAYLLSNYITGLTTCSTVESYCAWFFFCRCYIYKEKLCVMANTEEKNTPKEVTSCSNHAPLYVKRHLSHICTVTQKGIPPNN